ncbi:SDR family NAD(P)-dependent oxidoreductase [Dactylosporangium sp. CA-139066]|uniref:SDR family NAD(P)-dependent oxidoreductase n=1 Tax=Dactylosporangium sp. CA-139066 TaxID=3239930 RepID=UPI003D946FFA
MATVEPIAIIGMAGRFPGADDIEQFWQNLTDGRDCLTELTDEELDRYFETSDVMAHPNYVRRRPIIPDSDSMDVELFGMTPREAELRDPQYRMLLEAVHGALEHAGYDPMDYAGQIGLFAATNANRYRYDYVERHEELVESVGYSAIDVANHPDYMSTFVSYKLGLRGPSATVLTACSSSLTTVHMACVAIRAGDCDMAVAGGVDIEFPYHRGYIPIPGGIRAMDGVVRSFSADATGTNFGDGVGAVLLKPLSAAQADNDTIYAVVLGSACNNDGARKVGYTAPSVAGQSECVRKALAVSGVHPRDIGYVEAHGTATRVGDPIELAGLIDAFRSASPDALPAQYCGLGSVKSNIGHTGQAAGMAALIKTALALSRQLVPPSINATTPNPEVNWEESPFYLNTELRQWPVVPGTKRRAGVSSFGIGGTNAHLVLEEAPAASPVSQPPSGEVLLWSAMNTAAEGALRERLAAHFAQLDDAAFHDAAHTLRVGRTKRPVRAALTASGSADAAAGLRDHARVRTWDGVSREIVFAFPGQGAQYPAMCHALYDREPLFRQGCDAAFEVLEPLLGRDLGALWRAGTDAAQLAETEVTQPLLYVLEYTLAHCLRHWGVEPRQLVGHSLGELVAAAVAGVFDFETGLRVVAERARWIQRMPRGTMLAVAAGRHAVDDLIAGDVALAAINSGREVVLSGPQDAMQAAATQLAERGVASRTLTTSHAFHSASMAEASQGFAAVLQDAALRAPTIPIVSAATGTVMSEAEATSAGFWARQLVEPVNFHAAAATIFAGGPVTVLEVGPGRTLTALLRGRPDARETQSRCMPAVGRDDGGLALDDCLAQLWVDGAPVGYWRQRQAPGSRRVAVPGYPYQRRRYWLDPPRPQKPVEATMTPPEAPPPAEAPMAPPQRPVAGEIPASRWRLAELQWIRDTAAVVQAPPNAVPGGAGVAVLLAPHERRSAQVAQACVQRAGYRTLRCVSGTGGSHSGAEIDATDADAWLSLLENAATRSGGPVLVAHAALLDPPADMDRSTPQEQVAGIIDSVLAALKAAAAFQRRRGVAVHLLVLGRGLVDVTGGELVNPANAAVLGLLRTAELENPQVRCRVIDVAWRAAEHTISAAIADRDQPLLAIRGTTRWRPLLAPVPPAPQPSNSQLRYRGTYLITGGAGGMGLVLARALAETGLRPSIALLGRTPFAELPDRDEVDAALAAIADAGADVAYLAGDVGDPKSFDTVVNEVEQRFGPVNGIVHAAGIAGGGLLERRRPADVGRVLHPKIGGVLAIEETFARRRPLDFLVLCSSVAGLTGMFGSGDYAAANAFLDAHSAACAAGERRTVSVQWPGWAEVGMLARSAEAAVLFGGADSVPAGTKPGAGRISRPAAAGGSPNAETTVALELVRTPGRDWEFDEHVFEGVTLLPGTSLLQLAVLGARAGMPGDHWNLQIRDLVFLAPLVGDGPREIRVVVWPLGEGRRLSVQSRPQGGDGVWKDHASGMILDAEPVEGIGLDDLRARLVSPASTGVVDWIRFGPRWDSVTEVRGDDTERLARLVLREAFLADLDEHPIHPALVDVASGVLHDLVAGRAYAPFMYRKVVVAGPLTGDVHVHIRFSRQARTAVRAVDFDIYDTETGRLLLSVEGFAMREVAEGGLAAGSRTNNLSAPQATVPAAREPIPAGPDAAGPGSSGGADPAVRAPDRPDVLLPEEGATLLLELLCRPCPPVVFVGLADAERRVPGIAWADQNTAAMRPPDTPPAAGHDPGAERPPANLPGPASMGEHVRQDRPGGGDDSTLSALQRLWSIALGVPDIGLDDDFFEIGGNSLTAVQLTSQINAHFSTDLGAGTLFDYPTLRALATDVPGLRDATARLRPA